MTTPLLRPAATVDIGPVDIDYPDQIVYAQGFEVDAAGWAAGASSVATREPVFGGGFNYWLTRTSGSGTAIAQRTFTSLTIGRQYTIAGFVGRAPNTNVTNARFGVTGIGLGSAVTPANDAVTTQPVSYTFTATGTSHVVTMQATVNSSSHYAIWDDVTLTALAWTGPGTIEVVASAGDVTLNAASVPYATARVELPMIDDYLIEAIDPRESQRVTLTGADDYAGTSRTFDLGLRSREVDHKARVIRLDLASDEAMLMDYAPLSNDTGARAHEASLRAVCNYVLGKIGASLEAGTDNADVTAYWPLDNLSRDPRGTSTANFVAAVSGGAGTLAASTGLSALPGTNVTTAISLNVTTGTAGVVAIAHTVSVSPSRMYTFSAIGRFNLPSSAAGTRDLRLGVQWLDRDNNPLGSALGPIVSVNDPGAATTPWNRVRATALAPSAAVAARLTFRVDGGIGTGGQVVASAWHAVEGAELVTYFDGASSVAGYTCTWQDAANASPSTRTPTVTREPELFTWEAGVSAWEFLEPLTSSVGLRLFCDEHRDWRLINPAEYSLPGQVSIAGWNAAEGIDRIGRDDPNVYCTGVVVKYRWRDANGIDRFKNDTAGVPGRVLVWEYERPYPGPGAAAAILARRSGQGRVQDVTALADWAASPAVEASISLPGTVDQVGQISAVTWTLGDALMRIGTRGLTDAEPDSWLGWDANEEWEDVDALLEWEDA